MQTSKQTAQIILVSIILLFTGCASTKMSEPAKSELDANFHGILCGSLNYAGSNSDYLPKVVTNRVKNSAYLKYAYEIKYNVEPDTAFDLFNPFLILGAPKSSDNVLLSAQLKLGNGQGFEKSYRHAINLTKTTNLFSQGDTLSVMRKKGLIALRDAIDQQVLEDFDLLTSQEMTCSTQGK